MASLAVAFFNIKAQVKIRIEKTAMCWLLPAPGNGSRHGSASPAMRQRLQA
jgi:hypothetical protein